MSQPTTQHENLSKFLSSHEHLKWLHDIERQSFYQVRLRDVSPSFIVFGSTIATWFVSTLYGFQLSH